MNAIFQQLLVLCYFHAVIKQHLDIEIVQLSKSTIVTSAKLSHELPGPSFKLVVCHVIVVDLFLSSLFPVAKVWKKQILREKKPLKKWEKSVFC